VGGERIAEQPQRTCRTVDTAEPLAGFIGNDIVERRDPVCRGSLRLDAARSLPTTLLDG